MTKKVFLALIFLCGLASSLRSADALKSLSQKLKSGIKTKNFPLIAVMNFTYPRGLMSTGSSVVSERLVTYLVQQGVPVVERRLIQSLMEEKKMWESGLVDSRSIKAMGHVLGVDAIVVGTLLDRSDEATEVIARVIRVDTGEILAAGSVVTERSWRDRPQLPRVAQSRAPLPVSYMPMGSSQAGSMSNVGRYRLSDLEPKPRRLPYHPAPVPFFMPPSARQFEGGPIR